MALEEKVTQEEDLYLYEIFRNPVLFGEFVANYDKMENDEPFEFTNYQVDWLCDFGNYISLCCARAVGKTLYLTYLILWYLVFNVFPDDYITYHVPGRSHLEPVFTSLVKSLRTNNLLKNFIAKNAGINQSDYNIKLLNQASLICRIAGQTGDGRSVVGLHTPVSIVDESGYYPWGTWQELQPTLNTFTPGFRLIVSGVPDGRREKSVCFHADQEDSTFSQHRISALENPRFTAKDKLKAVEQYGGEDSEDYVHMVLGQHGRPVFTLFDRGGMYFADNPVYQPVLNGIQIGDNTTEYISRLRTLPSIPGKDKIVLFGIDLGYTDPTAIIILYLDKNGIIYFHARIQLNKVGFPIQEKIVDWLDTQFKPSLIGIDESAGGSGKSFVQHLKNDPEYIHKEYEKRLFPIDFSSRIVIGIDDEGDEIKVKPKPFGVTLLQNYSDDHRIAYSHRDIEMVVELERMTYTKNPSGEIVYRTLTARGGQRGEDHFTAALTCAILAYYLENEFIFQKNKRKALFKGGWFTG